MSHRKSNNIRLNGLDSVGLKFKVTIGQAMIIIIHFTLNN